MHSTESLISSKRLWASRIMSGLPVLFLLVDGGMKLFKPAVVVEATKQLGYPESAIVGIGVVLLISTFLYVIPRTAILGAILLTGYLGGAVASHLRVSLTDEEENDIVAFLQTLSDGFTRLYLNSDTFTGACMRGGSAATQGNELLIPTPSLPPCASAICGALPVPNAPIP
jgi:hypothetical protein